MTDIPMPLGPHACVVKDGRFVIPCNTLAAVTDIHQLSFTKAKGIFVQHLFNIETGEPSRSYFGVRSKQYKNGILFNFCPFCGVQLDETFNENHKPRDNGWDKAVAWLEAQYDAYAEEYGITDPETGQTEFPESDDGRGEFFAELVQGVKSAKV